MPTIYFREKCASCWCWNKRRPEKPLGELVLAPEAPEITVCQAAPVLVPAIAAVLIPAIGLVPTVVEIAAAVALVPAVVEVSTAVAASAAPAVMIALIPAIVSAVVFTPSCFRAGKC